MVNKDEVKGKAENLKGRAKQAVGAATGNKDLEAKGSSERVAGATLEKVGRAKRKMKDLHEDNED
jgi:uncharacterized protein YjbJ (UPF0337 family)